jgi:ubiquinone/menaquinone biosynthesis C-methylase UbiE
MAWFDDAFGPWYLKLYAHRDREEAHRTFQALDPWLPRGGRMLDVACGMGRHLEILIARGLPAVGLDRSATLLANAPACVRPHLVRGDMRQLPFPNQRFHGLFSFFTSFGYFGKQSAHEALLSEFARVAVEGGRMVLDVANPPQVRARLCPFSERTLEGYAVRERRTLVSRSDGDVVLKDIQVSDSSGEPVATFHEEVSLYERDALLDMLNVSSWREVTSLGDYDGSPWTVQSPRLIVIAEKRTA